METLLAALKELKQVCESVRGDLHNWPGLTEIGHARVMEALATFETVSESEVLSVRGNLQPLEPIEKLIRERTAHALEVRASYDRLCQAAHDVESLTVLRLLQPSLFTMEDFGPVQKRPHLRVVN